MFKVDVLVDLERHFRHRFNAQATIKSQVVNILGGLIIAEGKPAVIVLLEVIWMDDASQFLAAFLITAVLHLEHCVVGCSIDKCTQMLQTLEQWVLFEANKSRFPVIKVKALFKVGDNLLNPFILW